MRSHEYWSFIEENYPRYSSSSEIAYNDDLYKLSIGEVCGEARELLDRDYGGDVKNVDIITDLMASTLHIMEESVINFLKKQC